LAGILVFFVGFFSCSGPGVNTPRSGRVEDGAVWGCDVEVLGSRWWWNENCRIVTCAVIQGLSTVGVDVVAVVMPWTRECGLLTRATRSDHVGHVADVGGGGNADDGLNINVDSAGGTGMVVDGGPSDVTVLEQGISNFELSGVFSLAQVVVKTALLTVHFSRQW
jgi:hypothetical protein